MEDSHIVAMYWQRDESALSSSAERYGRYCYAIAYRILGSHEAAEECVNDIYLQAWETIPPARPTSLSAYLGMLTRRRAIDRLRHDGALSRGGGTPALSLDELADCLPAEGEPATALERQELARAISAFLRTLPTTVGNVFLRRYWYLDSIPEIAARYAMGESRVKMMLARTRKRLAAYLEKGGYLL